MKKKFLMFILILMCFVGMEVFAEGSGTPNDPVVLNGLDSITAFVNEMTPIDTSGEDVYYGYVGEYTITDAKYAEFGMYIPPRDENEYNVLPSQGWAQEGVSMYVSGIGLASPTNYYHVNF